MSAEFSGHIRHGISHHGLICSCDGGELHSDGGHLELQFDQAYRRRASREKVAESMKALSVRQPWANLIAAGKKTIETRKWATDYRGQILIVSSKTPKLSRLVAP